MMNESLLVVRDAYRAMRASGQTRHRDIAEHLGISEGHLIAAHIGVPDPVQPYALCAQRLRPQWAEMVKSLEWLGEVMALTRNASCVHEKEGVYRKVSEKGDVGLVLGGDIDLRIFYRQWHEGYAVRETSSGGEQLSLQFFDARGDAVHKVFLRPASDVDAYHALVARYACPEQTAGWASSGSLSAVQALRQDIDVMAFRAAWRALRDTHDFSDMLQRFGLQRLEAFVLADHDQARPVAIDSVKCLLEDAAHGEVPIMVFVGNKGVIQIHTGTVRRIMVMGPWLNVLDPGFNLHLRLDQVAHAWVVHKPTDDGVVSSLELFDREGEVIALFFGARQPGKPELSHWRALIDRLSEEAIHA